MDSVFFFPFYGAESHTNLRSKFVGLRQVDAEVCMTPANH